MTGHLDTCVQKIFQPDREDYRRAMERVKAIKELKAFPGQLVDRVLIRALGDDDSSVRDAAHEALKEHDKQQLADAIVASLSSWGNFTKLVKPIGIA